MKREKLEQYLGKKITVVMFDNDTATGIFTKDKRFNYYQCDNSFWFRSSHVKKVIEAAQGDHDGKD